MLKVFNIIGKGAKALKTIKYIIPYLEFTKKLIDFCEKEFPKQNDKLNEAIKTKTNG